MEFTDDLHLKPVRRPVPELQADEILCCQRFGDEYRSASSMTNVHSF